MAAEQWSCDRKVPDMSTHCIVGRYEDQSGIFVNFDGYPTGVGYELVDLIRRDGVETVMNNILAQEAGWVCLGASSDIEGLVKEIGAPPMNGIAGYGVAYDDDGEGGRAMIPVNNERPDRPWGYMLMGDGDIVIYKDGCNLGTVNAFSSDAKVGLHAINDAYDRSI